MSKQTEITKADFDRGLKGPFLDLLLKMLRNTYDLQAIQIMPHIKSPFSLKYNNEQMPLNISVDSTICSWILNNDEWSENIITIIRNFWLKKFSQIEPAVIVDIGAHQGFFTRQLLAILNSKSQAYCFEPEPRNFALLNQNIGFMPNCNLFNLALGPFNHNLELYKDTENHGNSSLNCNVVPIQDLINKNMVEVLVQNPKKYESDILSKNLPIIYKSDTQSLDCTIAVEFSENFWRRTEIAVIELWRIPTPLNFDRTIFRKILDLFPYKIISSHENDICSSDDVFDYINGIDGKGADLIMHK